jgi:hypothetical protein
MDTTIATVGTTQAGGAVSGTLQNIAEPQNGAGIGLIGTTSGNDVATISASSKDMAANPQPQSTEPQKKLSQFEAFQKFYPPYFPENELQQHLEKYPEFKSEIMGKTMVAEPDTTQITKAA